MGLASGWRQSVGVAVSFSAVPGLSQSWRPGLARFDCQAVMVIIPEHATKVTF